VTGKVSEESVSWRHVRNYVVKKQAKDGFVSLSIRAMNCRDREIVKDMIMGFKGLNMGYEPYEQSWKRTVSPRVYLVGPARELRLRQGLFN